MPGMPPPVTDERSGLVAFLSHQRSLVRLAAHGLTDEQASATPTASALSVGGLLKHLALVERNWMGTVRRQSHGSPGDYAASFSLAPGETLAGVLADYDAAALETDDALSQLDLDHAVPVPPDSWWMPKDIAAWSVRWVYLHLIEETARHAGHADIIRESLDGATWIPLLAAVEQWPANEWITPWQPATA